MSNDSDPWRIAALVLLPCALGPRRERGVGGRAEDEATAGLDRIETYAGFAPRVEAVRGRFRAFLAAEKAAGRRLAAYGAAAKGNTFLNYCGTTTDDIVAVFDASPAKQGRFLPGSHLPIPPPEPASRAARRPPDPALEPGGRDHPPVGIRESWGGRFVLATPETGSWPNAVLRNGPRRRHPRRARTTAG